MIETERLTLREWREGDDERLHVHCNTPKVMRWLGGVRTREWMAEVGRRLTRLQEERGHTLWVVERKADGAFLGFCGLKIANGSGSSVTGEVEIAWRLREDAWGQGYAKEAAIASLDYAFEKLRAPLVVALTAEGNAESRGLIARLGMARRADLDYVDPDWDEERNPVIVYALRREDWPGAR
ncbi:MAG: GNAT family N-acetyltransferase [Alphaproteobacteria bacterium]|nr:MAG: GNAT family N-acetyltransferase [Alphaproteobacteria bacterium]